MSLRCILLAAFWTLAGVGQAQEWNQWRGPTRDGQSPGGAWPAKLTAENFKRLWHVDLAPGYPGPIVSGDRVYVVESKDRKLEIARALDRATGKQLWEHSWEGHLSVMFIAARNGDWVRSTPALDGDRLYIGGMRDVVVCLEASTGRELWRYDFAKEKGSPLPAFGFVSSPVVDGGHVYVQAGASLAKLDKESGKLIWQRLQDAGAAYYSVFSSPTFATLQGKKQLVVQTRADLAGVDVERGEVLWKQAVPAYKNMNILTPLVFGNSIFTSTYGGKSFCYEIQPQGEGLAVETKWTNKLQGYMSSPVLINGHIYLHLRNQRFACIRASDGEEAWVSEQVFGQYWSMAARGDKMLALDQRGILYCFQANPKACEPLGELKVSEQETWGHLAVAGNEVYIRELRGLTAYRWE